MDGFGPPPQVPPRHSSDNSNKNSNTNFWRQPLGVFLAFLFVLAVLFSTACLVRYALRDKAVYDQLVDYIDKTISISKINYNRALGLYEVTEQEQGALHQQRKYKNLIWAFLGSDLLNFVFFGAVIGLFYCANVNIGLPHSLFWIMLTIGIVYSLLQVSVFTALIFPLSARLPNETSTLLDHAIPHNPGGLLQMENSIGCTFDHNLYNAFQRRANPNNTCDPQIARSYIPRPLLLTFIALRLAALLVFAVSLLLRFSCGSLITALALRKPPPFSLYLYQTDAADRF
uniref:ABC transmembrane type-1 domain-containing protein n=1 Tax=Panagrellus redivivus TaxID=6233 RepID=A0A7E4V252_PANRE